MKQLLRLEELTLFLASIYLFSLLGYPWWIFLILLLLPDIGMIGYAINPRIGAITYNLFHHKSVGIITGGLGIIFKSPVLLLIGIVLFAHACMDRMLGYGLKYPDSFWNTHLGTIKKPKSK